MPSVSAHVLQYANTSRAVEHIGQASAHGRVRRWAARRGRLATAVPGPAEKKIRKPAATSGGSRILSKVIPV